MQARTRLFLLLLALLLTGCRSPQTASNAPTTRPPAPTVSATPPPHNLTLTLSLDHSFPEQKLDGQPLRSTFQTVARDVLEVVQKRFEGANPVDTRPIVCYLSTEKVPRTDATQDPALIWIGLALPPGSLQRLDFARFAFQLAHELGHVMLDSRRSNGLIETLADAIAYQALSDLAELWPRKYADFAPWKDWAPNFQDYRTQDEQVWLKRFPPEIQSAVAQQRWEPVSRYLQQHQAELDQNPYTAEGAKGYALRSLGAKALLSQPVPWKEFTGIALLTTPSPTQDGRNRNDLPIELSRAPLTVQAALHRFRF